MKPASGSVTRRQFGRLSLMGMAGLGAASMARGQLDVDSYRALGMDETFDWSEPINDRSSQDFAQFLNPPEDSQYNPCAEAYPGADTPRGSIARHEAWSKSRIYPGTRRDIWIYQPVQLAASTGAPDLMVIQDGGGYVNAEGAARVPAVLDTLIHAGDLRPTVAVFVNPGQRIEPRDAADPERGRQRSLEYDSLTDAYVRFMLEEASSCPSSRARSVGRSPTDPAQTDDLRHLERRHLRLDGGVVPARLIRKSAEPLRLVHQHPWRPQLSVPGTYDRSQADPHVHDQRQERPRHPAGQLAAGQPADGLGPRLCGL